MSRSCKIANHIFHCDLLSCITWLIWAQSCVTQLILGLSRVTQKPFATLLDLGGERHFESEVPCPRTQGNDPSQVDSNLDCLIQSQLSLTITVGHRDPTWKFGRTINALGTQALSKCFHNYLTFSQSFITFLDQCLFLGNCPPSPPQT